MTDTPREFELIAKRIAKTENNLDVKPIDLLRTMIDNLETGELVCDSILIITLRKPPGTTLWNVARWRAGLPAAEEVLLLRVSELEALNHWIGR